MAIILYDLTGVIQGFLVGPTGILCIVIQGSCVGSYRDLVRGHTGIFGGSYRGFWWGHTGIFGGSYRIIYRWLFFISEQSNSKPPRSEI
jgi:hypothetical protein